MMRFTSLLAVATVFGLIGGASGAPKQHTHWGGGAGRAILSTPPMAAGSQLANV